MKKVIFSLAFALIASVSFANTSTAPVDCSAPVEAVSEQMITYEIDHPIMGKVLVSIPEDALENEALCGFPVSFIDGDTSGSFWMSCSGGVTMDDIMNIIYAMFW
jgi:hypothetical protein